MADMNSADILGVDWARRARELLAGAQSSVPKEKTPPEMWRGGTFRSEPVEIKQKNVFTDPNSWLNRGLEQLGRNAFDAVFGQESGNALVDYGASNIPGVGAGAILAAGGMPGLVDVTGLGALRNAKRLVKPVREFIMRNAGEEGLQAVDNYLTKFPKVGKLSMADADYLLTSGKLGQKFDVNFDTGKMAEIADNGFNENIDKLVAAYGDQLLPSDVEALRGLQGAFNTAIEKGDIADAANISSSYWTAMSTKFGGLHGVMKPGDVTKMSAEGEFEKLRRQHAKRMANPDDQYLSTTKVPDAWAAQKDEILDESRRMNEYLGVQMHPVQDFNKIEAAQLRRDAQQAEKAAKKASKQPQPQVTPEPVPDPVMEPVPEPVPEPPKGGPNKWRENGWTSEDHPIDAYSILDPKATEEDRRAMFVMDSLANEAVAKLIRNNRFKEEWPGASKLRHQGTNYDTKSREYGQDVAWNARTGNLPSNTSSLVLRTAVSSAGNRLPGQMTGVVDGNDLYDLLFRKKVDKKINELDNRYRVDF